MRLSNEFSTGVTLVIYNQNQYGNMMKKISFYNSKNANKPRFEGSSDNIILRQVKIKYGFSR